MTQQPNQNYPQPGGWGQQPPQQGGWGQQPAQQGGQWGAQQPQYGQQQPAQQQQYGGGAGYGAPAAGGAGATVWGKVWGFYATGALAVVAAVMVFLAWGSSKISYGGQSATGTVNAIGSASSSVKGADTSNSGYTPIWGWLLLIGAVVAVAGVVMVFVMKTALSGWIAVGGSAAAFVFAAVAALYFNSKISDAKTQLVNSGLPAGTKYTIGLGIGAYIGLAASLIAVVFAVLAQLSINQAGATAAAGGYSPQAYAQQQGYGQQQQPQQQAGWGQQPQAQPQPQQQAGWGQQQPAQDRAPQQGQQQWGNPQQPQQGQQQWGGFDPAANQPTQAVQPGYMPGQQPPPQQ